ncbi:MAG: diacylglycerol kinase [Pseudomonadota bacterium]|nr:diacylglycerol kinase [Pseudomonadota bacterium]
MTGFLGLLHRRLVCALRFSLQGLAACFRHEEAFRMELALFAVLAPLGFWLGDGGVEKALLVGVLVGVMIVELLNSAVEAAVDRIGEEHHELAGRAKDIGSAAVLMSMALVVLVWGAILGF